MSSITTRSTGTTGVGGVTRKDSPLSNTEIDNNFININTDKLEITDTTSTNTANKVVKRDASGNFSAGTITADLSGTAVKATNLSNGAAGSVPYQTGNGTTDFVAAGTSGQIYRSNGAAAPSWVNQSSLSVGSASTAGSATQYNGVDQPTLVESIKAGFNISGGGTITVDASGYVTWNQRFIVISNGNGTNFATSGYYDITVPAAGSVITGVGSAVNFTTTAAGIQLNTWQALYYILPIGSGNGSIAANFRIAQYQSAQDIPYNWILLCIKNGDDNQFYFPRGLVMGTGQSSSYAMKTENYQTNSLGVGTAASGTAGQIRATNSGTFFYSDERLKENIEPITDALAKVETLRGVTYTANDVAASFGYTKEKQVGVLAGDLEKVLPEVVKPAPFDITVDENGVEVSRTGQNYKTVQYEKIVPLLIEAIKELNKEIKELKGIK